MIREEYTLWGYICMISLYVFVAVVLAALAVFLIPLLIVAMLIAL